jgi:hypothetical protein
MELDFIFFILFFSGIIGVAVQIICEEFKSQKKKKK